jgi:hypothetical protein
MSIFPFLSNVFSHHLAWIGGILTIIGLIEKVRDASVPIPRPVIWWSVGLLLFVASYEAWMDEHQNAAVLIGEKAILTSVNSQLSTTNTNLIGQLGAKDRPVIIQVPPDPEIEKLLQRQDTELGKLKSQQPSPKKRALQVSHDMLMFLGDRTKSQPTFPIPTSATTREDSRRQDEQFTQLYEKWMRETAAEYQVRFSVPVAQILEDAKAAGIDTSGLGLCGISNGNTFGIQRCAASVGTLAEKLPH